MRRLNEPSHLDLRSLTFSLSIIYINIFPNGSLLKWKKDKKKKKKKRQKTDDKCRLKFGAERDTHVTHMHNVRTDRYAYGRAGWSGPSLFAYALKAGFHMGRLILLAWRCSYNRIMPPSNRFGKKFIENGWVSMFIFQAIYLFKSKDVVTLHE